MTGTDDVILELKDITKAYSGIVALKKADLKLRRGAVNVLVGENGAGKSTMMRIIAGVERPTLGEIWMDGERIHLDVLPKGFQGVRSFLRDRHRGMVEQAAQEAQAPVVETPEQAMNEIPF